MARKKKTTRKKTGGLRTLFSKTKKKGRKTSRSSSRTGLKIALSILFLAILGGGGAVGLVYLDEYVKTTAKSEVPEGPVVFKNSPSWLNQEWKNWIEKVLGGTVFSLDTHTAQEVSDKLKQAAWLKNIRVQTQPDCIEIYADYRKPVGSFGNGNKQVYVADDMMVMNYIPITAIPIVEIKGTSSKAPEPGLIWLADDAEAAVEILCWLYQMDLHFQLEKSILDEIESIDVSNFAARKSQSSPNIVFHVKDGITVLWGAAWGQSADYLEADEIKKLARLYQYFINNNNTLEGMAKKIELRLPDDGVPRPR